jgi:hypothetical protein
VWRWSRGPFPGALRFSRDGRWILFIRTRVVPVGQAAISHDTIELVRASGGGSPRPVIDFTSNDFSYTTTLIGPTRSTGTSHAKTDPQAA